MPFGSFFGAIVFGVFGVILGTRMFGLPEVSVKLMGACLLVLGIAVAAGLLMKRAWARWLGACSGFWFLWSAGNSFLDQGGVFYLTVVLAAAAAMVLLLVPATGRPVRDPSLGPQNPSVASRALAGVACLAIAGFVGAAASAVARQPGAKTVPAPDVKQSEARPGAPSSPATPAAKPPPAGGVPWRDFADGLKQAKQDRKLIVADFYATWCGPCKLMDKRTFHDPRVLARLRDVVPVRVDAEGTETRGGLRGADLAERYAIESYPTIVVVDGNGREIARSTGVLGPEDFLVWLDSVMERAATVLARS